MTEADYEEASRKALSLFEYGQVSRIPRCFSTFKSIKWTSYSKEKEAGSFTVCFLLQRVAQEHGLILVDTKYEFGKGRDGSILLIDEV